MVRNLIFIVFLSFSLPVLAQKKADKITPKDLAVLSKMEDTIALLIETIAQDTNAAPRLVANEALLPLMHRFFNIKNSFNYKFEKTQYLGIQQPEDAAFRVISWGVYQPDGTSRHYGFLQLNRSRPTYYELEDYSRSMTNAEKDVLTDNKWFGALYYNIRSFKYNKGTAYLLFGLNFGDLDEKTKVCDVLILRGGLRPQFGAPIFTKGQNTQNRLVLTYAAEAGVRLNYDEQMGMIVYDHLAEIPSTNPNLPFTLGPDGTYEAFQFRKGRWQYVEKIENNPMKEAPRPKPVLTKKQRVLDKEDAKKFSFPEEKKE